MGGGGEVVDSGGKRADVGAASQAPRGSIAADQAAIAPPTVMAAPFGSRLAFLQSGLSRNISK